MHQIGRFHDLRRRRRIGQQSPLQQLVHAPAPEPVTELHIRQRHRLHHIRIDQPTHLTGTAQHLCPLRIRQPRKSITGQHRTQVGRDPGQSGNRAVHTSSMNRATDIPTPE
jgi:hypothetical protein